MKVELKTEDKNYFKSFSKFFVLVIIFSLIIILFDVGLKLAIISRSYKINYNCRLLSVEKSKSHFKKLSRFTNLKSKQQIWEFCMDVIK